MIVLCDDARARDFEPFATSRPLGEVRAGAVLTRERWAHWFAASIDAAIAANRAEKVAPNLTLVDVQMIGAAGRLYMSGTTADVETGLAEIERVLAEIEGRKA